MVALYFFPESNTEDSLSILDFLFWIFFIYLKVKLMSRIIRILCNVGYVDFSEDIIWQSKTIKDLSEFTDENMLEVDLEDRFDCDVIIELRKFLTSGNIDTAYLTDLILLADFLQMPIIKNLLFNILYNLVKDNNFQLLTFLNEDLIYEFLKDKVLNLDLATQILNYLNLDYSEFYDFNVALSVFPEVRDFERFKTTDSLELLLFEHLHEITNNRSLLNDLFRNGNYRNFQAWLRLSFNGEYNDTETPILAENTAIAYQLLELESFRDFLTNNMEESRFGWNFNELLSFILLRELKEVTDSWGGNLEIMEELNPIYDYIIFERLTSDSLYKVLNYFINRFSFYELPMNDRIAYLSLSESQINALRTENVAQTSANRSVNVYTICLYLPEVFRYGNLALFNQMVSALRRDLELENSGEILPDTNLLKIFRYAFVDRIMKIFYDGNVNEFNLLLNTLLSNHPSMNILRNIIVNPQLDDDEDIGTVKDRVIFLVVLITINTRASLERANIRSEVIRTALERVLEAYPYVGLTAIHNPIEFFGADSYIEEFYEARGQR